ncbi:MAG: membrane protein insertase YidC [Desulfococcus sp. 4484_241]|nr:MAG: membrane protein insertase YidC [Desulfococcus sp. 4484_241]
MEQVRVVLAVVLSVFVLLVWQALFMPQPQKQGPNTNGTKTQKSVNGAEQKPDKQPGLTAEPERKATADVVHEPGPVVEAAEQLASPPVLVETDLYVARISGNGARVSGFMLKRYRETNDPDSPLKHLVSEKNPRGTIGITMDGSGLSGVDSGPYVTDVTGSLVVTGAPRSITWSRHFKNGVVVEKRYTFTPGSYMIGLEVTVKNGSGSVLPGRLGVMLARYFPEKHASRFVFEGPCALVGGKELHEIKLKDIAKKGVVSGKLDWISIQNRYFMSALIPEAPSEAVMRAGRTQDHVVTATYLASGDSIAPDSARTYRFKVFMGPKSVSLLHKAGYHLDRAVNFGMFDFLARPCLWLMNLIYRFIPNYGVAIILLTILFKLIFWPLGNKSYKSMADMKRLQPLMAEIREKYKNDRKKMNEEVMNLYRTYKINPLGGCLPMLVQIPVFFAFYRMLYQAIELRHAPFCLWINDLSAPDRLFHFNISVPIMTPPVGIPVLTLVMGLTMIVQQKLQPPAGDPTQAKMMMLMPVVFTFIFINFPSGLVLYWLVNNIISIFQQYYITRKNA